MEGAILPLVLERLGMIWAIFISHPKVYFPLIGEWYLVIIYFMLSRDKESLADVYAAGVTLMFIGFELMPFHDFHIEDPTFYLSVGLMVWGLALVLLAATKVIPEALARILGTPTATALPALLIILAIETDLPIDILSVCIILAPALVLELTKFILQLRGK